MTELLTSDKPIDRLAKRVEHLEKSDELARKFAQQVIIKLKELYVVFEKIRILEDDE